MDTIEKIEKYFVESEAAMFESDVIKIRIQIEIAKQLRGLTATIKNLRDV